MFRHGADVIVNQLHKRGTVAVVQVRQWLDAYEHLRRIEECPCPVQDLTLCMGAGVLEDFKGNYLVAFSGEWPEGYLLKHNPGLKFSDTLSV